MRVLLFIVSLLLTACKPMAPTTFAELDYPWPTQTVEVRGTPIVYTDVGQGPQTIVLIHGLGSYIPVWSRNLEALAGRYRVIALDLPGYGKSGKPDVDYSMAFFARKINALLHELQVEQPVLAGHSMGGQIALTYALMYPEHYAGLVLTAPAGLETFDDGEAKWLAQAVTPEFTCAATPEAIYTRHVQNFHKMPKDAHFMVDDRVKLRSAKDFEAYCRAVSRSVAGMLDGPVNARLGEISKPVLVIFGEHDGLIPNPFLHGGSTVKLAEREVERFPQGRLEVVERAGHMVQFEQADAWNDVVVQFVGGLPAPEPKAEAQPEPEQEPEPEPESEPEAEPEIELEPDAEPGPVEAPAQ